MALRRSVFRRKRPGGATFPRPEHADGRHGAKRQRAAHLDNAGWRRDPAVVVVEQKFFANCETRAFTSCTGFRHARRRLGRRLSV